MSKNDKYEFCGVRRGFFSGNSHLSRLLEEGWLPMGVTEHSMTNDVTFYFYRLKNGVQKVSSIRKYN